MEKKKKTEKNPLLKLFLTKEEYSAVREAYRARTKLRIKEDVSSRASI